MGNFAGVKKDLDLSFFSVQEIDVIRKLGRVWFITFARQTYYKNSTYTFVFAKPTDFLVDNFHLSREVLVLLTDYPNFESRALDFVDVAMSTYQNRLDKLCVIVVSADPQIKSKIADIAMQDKESRLILPYSFDELCRNPQSDSVIVNRLKEFFYSRDLFAFDSPLRNDTYFFGRSQIVQHLYGKYKSGENGCLFGLRRIGKTSVLLAVKRYMQLRGEPVIFFDCSEPSFHVRRWHETLHFMANSLVRSLNTTRVQAHSSRFYDEKNASQVFEEDLMAVYKFVGHQRLLFILDEIENVTFGTSPSTHWSEDRDYVFFWQSLRSLFQKNTGLFSFIMAGVNPKAIETPTVQGYDNPIYRWITPAYLGFFDVQEVREMVLSIGNYMGLQFEDEVFTYLTDDYGGHPFLIRQVCSRIHNSTDEPRPYTVTKFRYQSEREKLSRSIQDYIGLIVGVLQERYRDEYELLEHLAQGDQKTFQDFAQMSRATIEHLEGYGLVREDNDKYHFRIKAVENYIAERSRVAKVLSTRDDKWRAITTGRNRLETDLRRVVKMVLKLQYGAKAKDTFLEIVSPPDRKAKLALLNVDEIFDGQLFFEDLRKVILKHWQVFASIFNNDRERFQNYMEYVNANRADAHANDISDDTLGLVLISLQWLQRHVDSFLK